MMNRKLTTMTILLLAATLAGNALAQAPAADAPPATTRAAKAAWPVWISRLGQLVLRGQEPDLRHLQADITTAIWTSDAAKRAMRDLNLSDAAARKALTISWPPAFPGRISLTLFLPQDTPDARKAGLAFLSDLTDHVIPDVVARWADQANRQPLVGAEEAVDERRKVLEVATAKAAQQRHAVRDAANVLDPSPEAVRGAASRLDQEKQRITLELAGQSARQKALEERVAKLSDAATARVVKDPIADELEKIVKLRDDEAANSQAMYKTGTLTQAELRAAQARAAEAKARLLERRETVSKAAGTELLGDLNKELVTLTINIAENEARLRYLDERLAGLSKALELVDDLEQLQSATARARRQLDDAETTYQSLARQISTAPPFVVSVQWDDPIIQAPGAPDQPRNGGGLFGGKEGGQ
jgi:hypothetical protein